MLLAQSALCVLLVVMLAAGVIGIYNQGVAEKLANPLAWIYTREKVVAMLTTVLPVFLLSVALTVACVVLNVRDEEQDKPVKDIELNRNLMLARVVEPSEAMTKEQDLQRKLRYAGWAGFGLCMLPILLYMIDGSHFLNGDLEEMIISLAWHVLPWTIAGLACLVASTVVQGKSMEREYDAIMARSKEEKAAGVKAPAKENPPARDYGRLRFALLAVAVALIVAGIFNGSMTAVVNKAIRICTECVGLG